MKEALLYEKVEGSLVHCFLCNHHCRIADQKFGFCGVRQNIAGTLYTHVYGKVIASHLDPIEKKPLYHFLPSTNSFSIATIGCNFHCGFCQNWEISQNTVKNGDFPGEEVSPGDIVKLALKSKAKSISYTYTEPTIFFEYALDIAKLAKDKGLCNVFVSNGYMTRQAITLIKPYLDAANIDLKFFNDDSYKKICSGTLAPVLESIYFMKEVGIWVEVTTLVIPGENDSDKELMGIAEFIASVDKNMPWHISGFHPDYKFQDHQSTGVEILNKAAEIGKNAGLNYVYIGNVYGRGNDTVCSACKRCLIKREGFKVLENNIQGNKCSFCNFEIPGVFE